MSPLIGLGHQLFVEVPPEDVAEVFRKLKIRVERFHLLGQCRSVPIKEAHWALQIGEIPKRHEDCFDERNPRACGAELAGQFAFCRTQIAMDAKVWQIDLLYRPNAYFLTNISEKQR